MSFLFDFVSPLQSDCAWESFKRLRNQLLFIYFFWRGRSGRETPQCVILFQPVCLSSILLPPSQYGTTHSCCTSAPLTGIFLWDFVNTAHHMSSSVIVCHHVSEDKVLCIWGLLSPWPVFIQMISSVKLYSFRGTGEIKGSRRPKMKMYFT